MNIPSKTERLIQKNDFFLTRGHDFVEIDGIKWATCNIGAKNPTDPGLYFQWGATKGYTAEEVSKGKYLFIPREHKYHHIGKPILEASDDAAHVNWGGAWRMPTRVEFFTLCNAVNTVWVENYQGTSVAGVLCIDKTDVSKKLFFPATGFYNRGERFSFRVNCPHWTSSIYNNEASYYLMFGKYTEVQQNSVAVHNCGMPIRPIINIH